MPPLDTPPRFQLARRLSALGVQAGFTFPIALVAADIASQLAPPHQRAEDVAFVGDAAHATSPQLG